MGITILQPFPENGNRTGPQTIELLKKKVVALGAIQSGQFIVSCEIYSFAAEHGSQKTLNILHNSEQPASVFNVLHTGNKTISLAADSLFDLIMLKITSISKSKKLTKVESKGSRFEIGDFCVKLGNVCVNQKFKGVLVEVEYRPCVIPANCWNLMREFLQGLFGTAVQTTPPQFLQNRMQEIYTPMDTIQQYLEEFSIFKKMSK